MASNGPGATSSFICRHSSIRHRCDSQCDTCCLRGQDRMILSDLRAASGHKQKPLRRRQSGRFRFDKPTFVGARPRSITRPKRTSHRGKWRPLLGATGPPTRRDLHVAMVTEHGRLGWQAATGYGRLFRRSRRRGGSAALNAPGVFARRFCKRKQYDGRLRGSQGDRAGRSP